MNDTQRVVKWYGPTHTHHENLDEAAAEREEMLIDWINICEALGFTSYADTEVVIARAERLVKDVNNLIQTSCDLLNGEPFAKLRGAVMDARKRP